MEQPAHAKPSMVRTVQAGVVSISIITLVKWNVHTRNFPNGTTSALPGAWTGIKPAQ
jgi:hypothetical protein